MALPSVRGTRDPIRLLFVTLLALVLVLLARRADAKFEPPPMRDAVTDTSGKLSPEDDRVLEEEITAYRNRTGNEIAVLVVASLGGRTIEDVAYDTFNAWGIGKKGLDNGVLLVIAPTERRTRIETGKGIGHLLTDIDCAIILRERVGPLLKEDRFREAIAAAVEAIEAALDGKPAPDMPPSLRTVPLVRGAFVVDTTGSLSAATLEELETAAAKDGWYWHNFAIAVVRGQEDAGSGFPPVYGEITKKRNTMPAMKNHPPMVYLVDADTRAVDIKSTVVWQYDASQSLEPRLTSIAQGAPDLESAIRTIIADQTKYWRWDEATKRDASRKEAMAKAESERSASRFVTVMASVIGLGVLTFIVIAVRAWRRGGGGGGGYGSSSSSSYDYGSSSSSSSYDYGSSSSSSSSVDTSYSGGGGSSGGGGASDSY